LLPLLNRLVLRHLFARKLEALLCVFGVAVGTAVTVGVDLAVRSSTESFAATVDALAGDATHSIVAGKTGLDEQLFVDLYRRFGRLPMTPIIDRAATVEPADATRAEGDAGGLTPATDRIRVRVLGVDPFVDREFRGFSDVKGRLASPDLNAFLTEPNTCVLVEPLARRLNVAVGSVIPLRVRGRSVAVRVLGTFALDGPAADLLDDLAVMDIAGAQELFGTVRRLDRIDLKIDPNNTEHERWLEEVRRLLPAGAKLVPADEDSEVMRKLTASYKLNLEALSLMAAMVAVFVVYNTLLVSVAHRRTTLGIIRCLGGTPRQLAGLYLAEALIMGVLGAGLGLLLGRLLSFGLNEMVAQTVSQFYGAVRPAAVELTAITVLKGLAVGIASALAGAAVPIVQASRVEPILAIRRANAVAGGHKGAVRLFWVGLFVAALALPAMYWPPANVASGFVGALYTLLGFALMSPLITLGMCRVFSGVGAILIGPMGRLGPRNVAAALPTAGVAVAALMSALAMSVGIGTMVAGFRSAVSSWLDRRYRAQVFLSTASQVHHRIDTPLPAEVLAALAADPEFAGVMVNRYGEVELQGRPYKLLGTDVTRMLAEGSLDLQESLSASIADLSAGVLITRSAADRLDLALGDTLHLPLPVGSAPLTVTAIYNDFSSDRGTLVIPLERYRALFADDTVNSAYVYLKDPSTAGAVRDRLLRLFPDADLVVSLHGEIKQESMTIFDRTFAVTRVLQWLAYVTAFCGLLGTLAAQTLRRLREFGVLKLLGMSRGATVALVLVEVLTPALIAALLALPVGTLLAAILAKVIQYRSFGWSIPLSLEPGIWISTIALAAAAAPAAGLYPLIRVLRLSPAAVMREE